MNHKYTRQQCLDLVLLSPEAVAIHDKAAWLSIFAQYNIVEDPVGSKPHLSGVYDGGEGQRGFGPLNRFYETFIAANQITFQVERDVVCGLEVIRDLTMSIQMSPKVLVHVPMHLKYELIDQNGELKVQRLAAFWELGPMLQQQVGLDWPVIKASMSSGLRMVKYLGIGGAFNFMRALRSIGAEGKEKVQDIMRWIDRGDYSDKDNQSWAFNAQFILESGETLSLDSLMEKGGRISSEKMLSAGNFVSVSCQLEFEQKYYHGTAFIEFNMLSRQPVGLCCYLSDLS
jgi:hypothetical protein